MTKTLSRRKFLSAGALAAGALAGPWSLAARALGSARVRTRAYFSMNTLVEVTAVGETSRLESACEAAAAACRAVDRRMNFYDRRSELSEVNARAGAGWTALSPELFEVLDEAARVWEGSEGAFDPAVGAAVRLYRAAQKSGRWPGAAQSEEIARSCGFASVELDRANRRVRFSKPGLALDLGGIAKGYAVDRAVAAMKEQGACAGAVNAGGDLYVFGTNLDDAPRAAVEDPFAPGRVIERLALLEESLCTSGDSEQGVVLEGRPCSHLIDPATGAPAKTQALGSASVRAERAVRADAWASALFVRPSLLNHAPVRGLLLAPDAKHASAGFFASAGRTG